MSTALDSPSNNLKNLQKSRQNAPNFNRGMNGGLLFFSGYAKNLSEPEQCPLPLLNAMQKGSRTWQEVNLYGL